MKAERQRVFQRINELAADCRTGRPNGGRPPGRPHAAGCRWPRYTRLRARQGALRQRDCVTTRAGDVLGQTGRATGPFGGSVTTGWIHRGLLMTCSTVTGTACVRARHRPSCTGDRLRKLNAPVRTINGVNLITNLLGRSEAEVLRMAADGIPVLEIAHRLRRSPKAVAMRKHSGMRKMGIDSDAELRRLRDELLQSLDASRSPSNP